MIDGYKTYDITCWQTVLNLANSFMISYVTVLGWAQQYDGICGPYLMVHRIDLLYKIES